jgi:TetR/AcrR family tetracycline transcriptional repressor
MAIDRETVVKAAVRLIDEHGLEALTLRRLASELGVQAPALYWHVRNKRELLDLVAVELTNEQRGSFPNAPKEGQDWAVWLQERTLAARQALLSHRDSALIAAGNRPTPDSLPGAEELLASLTAMGLPPEEALMLVLSSGYYLIGGVLERQVSAARDTPEADSARAEAIGGASGEFPLLQAAMVGLLQRIGWDEARDSSADVQASIDEEVFRFGLDLMIDGLRARLERTRPQ